MTTATPLECFELSKRFGEQLALDGLTFKLERGEIVGFLGPNGSGKTTTLHIAMGFLRPTSGRGLIFGEPFRLARVRRRVGFLPDAPAFFSHSAQEAVQFTAKLQGVSSKDTRERVPDLLQRLEIPAQTQARRLSRGMQQRLGIAQALVHDPDLLLLDEPTSALDPEGVQIIRKALREASGRGKSIFFSSHQLSEVEQLCDRIIFLYKGKLLRQGSLVEFINNQNHTLVRFRYIDPMDSKLQRFQPFLSSLQKDSVEWTIENKLHKELIEAAWSAGGELLTVTPVRRNLEDLFLSWTTHEEEK